MSINRGSLVANICFFLRRHSLLNEKGREILVSLREVYIYAYFYPLFFLFEKENINCRIPTQIIVYTFP